MKAFQSRPSPVSKPHRSREAAAARFPAEARLAGLQAALNAAAPAQRLRAAQGKANGRDAPAQRMDDEDKALQEKALQRVDDEDTALQETPIQHRAAPYARPVRVPLQRKGGGGLPDDLRSGIESLSGLSMDGVRVHRNSAAPARVGAHAYAQGTDIHLAPGQDRHLPHEAWHVVQQAQGRVRPTMDVAGTPVNDDAGLEAEADRMGAQALQRAAALDWQPLAMLQRNADGEEMADVTGPDGLEVAFLPADRLPALRRTAQFRASPHGVCQVGDVAAVARLSQPTVAQLEGWGDYVRGIALILEGIVTAGAAVAMTYFTWGEDDVDPARVIASVVMVAGSGLVKIFRGIAMMTGRSKKLLDITRGIEALLTGAGAATSAVWLGVVFGVIKLARSGLTLLADTTYKDNATVKRGLSIAATVAHALEVMALGAQSYLSLSAVSGTKDVGKSTALIIGGAGSAYGGASKTGRAIDQGISASKIGKGTPETQKLIESSGEDQDYGATDIETGSQQGSFEEK